MKFAKTIKKREAEKGKDDHRPVVTDSRQEER